MCIRKSRIQWPHKIGFASELFRNQISVCYGDTYAPEIVRYSVLVFYTQNLCNTSQTFEVHPTISEGIT